VSNFNCFPKSTIELAAVDDAMQSYTIIEDGQFAESVVFAQSFSGQLDFGERQVRGWYGIAMFAGSYPALKLGFLNEDKTRLYVHGHLDYQENFIPFALLVED